MEANRQRPGAGADGLHISAAPLPPAGGILRGLAVPPGAAIMDQPLLGGIVLSFRSALDSPGLLNPAACNAASHPLCAALSRRWLDLLQAAAPRRWVLDQKCCVRRRRIDCYLLARAMLCGATSSRWGRASISLGSNKQPPWLLSRSCETPRWTNRRRFSDIDSWIRLVPGAIDAANQKQTDKPVSDPQAANRYALRTLGAGHSGRRQTALSVAERWRNQQWPGQGPPLTRQASTCQAWARLQRPPKGLRVSARRGFQPAGRVPAPMTQS